MKSVDARDLLLYSCAVAVSVIGGEEEGLAVASVRARMGAVKGMAKRRCSDPETGPVPMGQCTLQRCLFSTIFSVER